MEADSLHAQDIEPPQNEEQEVGDERWVQRTRKSLGPQFDSISCSGVEDEIQIYQQQTLNDEKFLEKVLNQFR